MSPYAEDLAYIHDVGFGRFADQAGAELIKQFTRFSASGGPIVDLGCGSGIWARRLADAGYQVVGVDISPAMIAICRQRVPEATWHVGSCLDFDIPNCQVVTALGEVFNYLFDESNSDRKLQRLAKRVYAALTPGGQFVFDAVQPSKYHEQPGGVRVADDWACLVRYEYAPQKRRLTRHIVTFRRSDDLYRRRDECHRIRLLVASEVARMLRATGFRVRVVRRFGSFPLLPGRFGVVATKPQR